MQPEFAKVVDPIFEAALRLESRIENNEPIITADERATMIRKIEEAEARFGPSQEWQLSKYAICSWIDSRLIESPWRENEWWKNNCLEKKFFGTRDAHEEFFKRAVDAASLNSKNALEVFYIAVVLGFRGFYGDGNVAYARRLCDILRIPPDVEAWCRETARAIHRRPGLPQIPGQLQAGSSPRPLSGRAMLRLYSMASTLLVAVAVAIFILLFAKL